MPDCALFVLEGEEIAKLFILFSSWFCEIVKFYFSISPTPQ